MAPIVKVTKNGFSATALTERNYYLYKCKCQFCTCEFISNSPHICVCPECGSSAVYFEQPVKGEEK